MVQWNSSISVSRPTNDGNFILVGTRGVPQGRRKRGERKKERKKGEEEELGKDEAFGCCYFRWGKEGASFHKIMWALSGIFPHILVTSKSFYLAVTILFLKPLLKQKQSPSVSLFLSRRRSFSTSLVSREMDFAFLISFVKCLQQHIINIGEYSNVLLCCVFPLMYILWEKCVQRWCRMTFQGGSFEHWKHLNYMSFWYSLCGEMEVSSFALLLFGRIHCVSTCTVQFCFGNKEQVENVSFLST